MKIVTHALLRLRAIFALADDKTPVMKTRREYADEAIARQPRDRNLYAIDGLCHNAETGTYGHECGKPATWIGTKPGGWACGFCDHCKEHGAERHGFETWERVQS